MGESERAGGKAMKCTIPSFGQGFFYLQVCWIILGFMWGHTGGVYGALVWLLSARLAGWAGGAGEVGGWVRVDGQVVQQFNAMVQNRQ